MNTAKTAFLLAALSAVFLAIGYGLGGQSGLVIAFVFAAIFNFGSYWFSDRIVLRMYRAREVSRDHRIYRLTQSLVTRAGLPMPRVYEIPTDAPNAFATGRNPEHSAVAVTSGLLQVLDDPELSGVIAHELAHVKNRDILVASIAATIASAVMMLASMARWAAIFGGGRSERGPHPATLIVTALVAPLAAVIIQSAISRQREFGADRVGAQIAGSPHGLASALRKIEGFSRRVPMTGANPATQHLFIIKPFTGRQVLNLFSTHPPTDERIRRLVG